MPKFRVVMIDYDYETIEPIGKPIVEAGGEFEGRKCKSLDEALEFAKDADGIIIQYLGPAADRMFTELPNLKVVARMGIGLDPIDKDSATRHGVAVVNVPTYCEDEVSDQAMALLLACARKIVFFNNQVQSGGWDFNEARPIHRLRGQTMGLLGLGKIPRALAPKAQAFGFKVIAHDPYVKPEDAEAIGVKLVDFDTLLGESDFLSIHCPLLDSTRGMMNAEAFAKMKPSAVVINTARGPIIDEAALAAAIKSRKLGGAGLDVLTDEPPKPNNPLLHLSEVLIAPHVGFFSEESLDELLTKAGLYTAEVLLGKRPEGLANPEVLGTAQARVKLA